MSLAGRTVLNVDKELWPRIIGKQGQNIKKLVQLFKVTIVFPSNDSNAISIEGDMHKEAAKAIQDLLKDKKSSENKMETDTPAEPESSPKLSLVLESTHTYLKFRLRVTGAQLEEKSVKKWIDARLESFAGKIGGGAIGVDVLVVNAAEKSFVVKIPISDASIVQAAITTSDSYQKQPCAPELIASSPLLTAMASPDRFISASQYSTD